MLLLLLGGLFQQGCDIPKDTRAVYVLVDIQDPYVQQSTILISSIRRILNALKPADSISIARIDTENFSKKNVISYIKFEHRPAMANAQKRAFLASVKQFCKNYDTGKNNDITGGILHAIEYLNETKATETYILLLSDLKSKVKGGHIQNFTINFNGIQVIAMQMKTLDIEDEISEKYLKRIAQWKQRVITGEGQWVMIKDAKALDKILN